MKAMMLTGIRQMEMMDIPEPELVNSSDVKIRMSVVGICGLIFIILHKVR